MKIIFLIIIAFGLLQADFIRGDKGVEDTISNLEWQDNEDVNVTTTWETAIHLCESLELYNQTDWRLPNINELKSLIDREKYNPAIISILKYYSISNGYWSSSTVKKNKDKSWGVNFNRGYVYRRNKSGDSYVRCVRGGE